jgi:hypothetical protein
VATHMNGVADGLWAAFRALPPDSRERFMQQMLADRASREELEDLLDLEVARERAHEPTRPLDDVLAEIER